jgi:hypothetical protein
MKITAIILAIFCVASLMVLGYLYFTSDIAVTWELVRDEKGNNGIQVVQRYKLHITQRSLNIIRELRNYRWAEDKVTGELKNEPAKSEHFDHALDALRYLVTAKLQQRRTGTAKYNPTYLYQYGQ